MGLFSTKGFPWLSAFGFRLSVFHSGMTRIRGLFVTSACSIIIINTKRTKIRTTLYYTELKIGAYLFSVDLSNITGVPYGPDVNNATGKRLIHRVSTLNNRVNGTTSGAFVRSEVLGQNGNPTICSLHTRVSHGGCGRIVGRAVRERRGLRLHRNRIADIRASRGGYIGNICAGAKTCFPYGDTVVYAKACLGSQVVVNSFSRRDKPSKIFPTARLSRGLQSVKIRLIHFGAKAPSHITGGSVSFSGLRMRCNSRSVAPFSFRAGKRLGGRAIYRVACAGRRARGVVVSGVRHSPLCNNSVGKVKPECYPSVRSGVIHFHSGRERRLFVRPVKLGASRVCVRNFSDDLPRSIRLRVLHSLANFRGTRMVHGTCTVRCSYTGPLRLGTGLRFGRVNKLCNTKRFGKASNCRRTTTRKLITNVGTICELLNGRPFVLSEDRTCVKALVSSLMAGNAGRPCQVVASHSRCELLLHRSGTSLHLARGNCRVKLVSGRECRRFLGGGRSVRGRQTEVRTLIFPPSGRIGSCLLSEKDSPVAAKIGTKSVLGQPRISCFSVNRVSGGQPLKVSTRITRRIRVDLGCRNCVGHRRDRTGRFGELRGQELPRRVGCRRVSKLHLRTERGLGGVHPRSVNRTSEVSKISPTSVTILVIFLSGE